MSCKAFYDLLLLPAPTFPITPISTPLPSPPSLSLVPCTQCHPPHIPKVSQPQGLCTWDIYSAWNLSLHSHSCLNVTSPPPFPGYPIYDSTVLNSLYPLPCFIFFSWYLLPPDIYLSISSFVYFLSFPTRMWAAWEWKLCSVYCSISRSKTGSGPLRKIWYGMIGRKEGARTPIHVFVLGPGCFLLAFWAPQSHLKGRAYSTYQWYGGHFY